MPDLESEVRNNFQSTILNASANYDLDNVENHEQQSKLLATLNHFEKYSNITAKGDLRSWAMMIVERWLIFVATMFILHSFLLFDLIFYISDTVILTLLGTTTLNILGLMYIVLKGYFK